MGKPRRHPAPTARTSPPTERGPGARRLRHSEHDRSSFNDARLFPADVAFPLPTQYHDRHARRRRAVGRFSKGGSACSIPCLSAISLSAVFPANFPTFPDAFRRATRWSNCSTTCRAPRCSGLRSAMPLCCPNLPRRTTPTMPTVRPCSWKFFRQSLPTTTDALLPFGPTPLFPNVEERRLRLLLRKTRPKITDRTSQTYLCHGNVYSVPRFP